MAERRGLILLSVLIGTLMSAIDTTIVILALPTITSSFKNASFIETIWVILIYLLVLAVLTTQMGRLGDIFGRGRIFNIGFLIFIAGSGLAGISPTVDFLIGFRALQGFGAVLIQANSSAIVADHFPAGERGKAFGITSMGWNIGGTLGIVLGGFITTLIGWRYIFYINVPIGLIGFVIALLYIKDDKKSETKIDFIGTSILFAILALVAYGATDIAGHGLNIDNLIEIVAGILMIIPFIFAESRVKSPLIQLSAFRERLLSYSLLAATLQAVGYLSVVFILIMYLQGIRGFSPLYASILLVPGYVLASFLAPLMGRYADRIGAGIVATVGIFFMSLGVFVYLFLGIGTSIYVVILGSVISGFGGSMFWPSNSSSVMSSSPRELYGSISGLLRTLSNMGTLLSYVITITVAAETIPRQAAYAVFLGKYTLGTTLSKSFLTGLHSALIVSIMLLIIAGIFSIGRAKKARPQTWGKDNTGSGWQQASHVEQETKKET
jgi:EmrB/QacA subfamily drug resistance transporter